MAADRHHYRRLRRRVTLASTLLVLVVLAASGWVVTRAHREVLVDNLGEALAQAVADLGAASGDDGATVVGFGDDDAAYQVVVDGAPVRASPNVAGAPPLAPEPETGAVVRTVHGLPHDEGDFLVRSERVVVGATSSVVHVAAPLDDIDESAASLGRAMLLAVPATTLVLGVALWLLVGRLLAGAEAAARRQDRFVADASHELRGPLTRMRTELEVDLAHPERADLPATQRLVLDEALGMQRLVDDLLHLARADSTHPPGRSPTTVDLDELVAQAARDLRASTALEVRAVTEAVAVPGRRDELARALRNLTENAARHATSSVRIDLARRGATAVLAVGDDGPGIPAEDRERVFDRFSRADPAREASTGGTGLGLAIVRDIVEAHGGTVRVDADHTGGARLEVVLPAAPDAQAADG